MYKVSLHTHAARGARLTRTLTPHRSQLLVAHVVLRARHVVLAVLHLLPLEALEAHEVRRRPREASARRPKSTVHAAAQEARPERPEVRSQRDVRRLG